MPNSHEKEFLKQVMAEVMKEGGVENNQTKSLWKKMYYSKRIREKLVRLGINGSMLLNFENEVERDKETPSAITREAMERGVLL